MTTRVEVELEGRWTMGETVTDLVGVRRSPWPVGWEAEANARVALEVAAEEFMERLGNACGHWSRRGRDRLAAW